MSDWWRMDVSCYENWTDRGRAGPTANGNTVRQGPGACSLFPPSFLPLGNMRKTASGYVAIYETPPGIGCREGMARTWAGMGYTYRSNNKFSGIRSPPEARPVAQTERVGAT